MVQAPHFENHCPNLCCTKITIKLYIISVNCLIYFPITYLCLPHITNCLSSGWNGPWGGELREEGFWLELSGDTPVRRWEKARLGRKTSWPTKDFHWGLSQCYEGALELRQLFRSIPVETKGWLLYSHNSQSLAAGSHWEGALPWVRQFSDAKVVPRRDCCHQQKFPASREWKLSLQRESDLMCWPPWLFMMYIVPRENRFQKHVYSIIPLSENKHLCYVYKFSCLGLEKNVGREIQGSLHTWLQGEESVKGKGLNKIINYFRYFCAVLMIMWTCQLYTVTMFN